MILSIFHLYVLQSRQNSSETYFVPFWSFNTVNYPLKNVEEKVKSNLKSNNYVFKNTYFENLQLNH